MTLSCAPSLSTCPPRNRVEYCIRSTQPRTLEFIRKHEGFRQKAYRDADGAWAIGYGYADSVHKDMVITREQAEVLLLIKTEFVAEYVERVVSVPITPKQKTALVSLAYNIGVGAFRRSTLLRKLNEGDYSGAARQFTRWVHSGGTKLRGLEKRRRAEMALFQEGI